jgi:hypothetical protein
LAASLDAHPCVRRQLATADVGATARQSLQRALEHWIRAIEGLARETAAQRVRVHLQASLGLAKDEPTPIES